MDQYDHFQRLGLPRRFSIDPVELERSYLAQSRAIHPDYHAGSEAELSASQELSACLNEAYKVLGDPFARADYLLTLEGGPTASEHKQLPANFLAETLEAREEVEQSRGDAAALELLEQDFQNRSAAIVRQIENMFIRYESLPANDPLRANLLTQIRGMLNAAKYVRGLIRDLHAD